MPSKHFAAAAAAFAPLGALLWAASAHAAPACVGDRTQVCVDVVAAPGSSVQPSRMVGTDTYVRYNVTVSVNRKKANDVGLLLDLPNGYAINRNFGSFDVPADVTCTPSGGKQVSCTVAHLNYGAPKVLRVIANAAPFKGTSTATQQTATASLTWDLRSASVTHTLPVSLTSGTSFVPPNQGLGLATAPEAAEQVTADKPLWAWMIIPARPESFVASVAVVDNGPDRTADCSGDFSTSGPTVCRDTGNPRRWIMTDLPDYVFTPERPLQFTLEWDASIIPGVQSTDLTPPFAIYHNQTDVGVPYGPTRAFANRCGVPAVAPCISFVSRNTTTGDWRAMFYKGNDGSDMQGPLGSLQALLDYFISGAYATPVTVGPVVQ